MVIILTYNIFTTNLLENNKFIRFLLPFLNSILELSYATSFGHRFFSDQPN